MKDKKYKILDIIFAVLGILYLGGAISNNVSFSVIIVELILLALIWFGIRKRINKRERQKEIILKYNDKQKAIYKKSKKNFIFMCISSFIFGVAFIYPILIILCGAVILPILYMFFGAIWDKDDMTTQYVNSALDMYANPLFIIILIVTFFLTVYFWKKYKKDKDNLPKV